MFKNYVKIALKVLLRHKLFTAISLFGISFTLLILVVITSFIDHTFGPVAPEKKLDRTLSVTMARLNSVEGGTLMGPLLSYYFFEKYVKTLKTPELISVSSFHTPSVTYVNNKKVNLNLKFTDGEFWKILDFEFLEGKPFTSQDVENEEFVAVINEETRLKYFNGEPAVGKTIEADGKNYRVVGVVKNVSILRIMPYADVWLPFPHTKDDLDAITLVGGFPGNYAMLLARNSSDIQKIKDEFEQQLAYLEFPEGRFEKLIAEPSTYAEALSRQFFMTEKGSVTPVLLILFILMVLFMILPTVNLVNINISRIIERSSEIGVRKAFGASSKTLIGQFVVENVIITLIGGAISLILAAIVLNIINQSNIIPHAQLGLNFRIFFYSLIICLFFGLFSGVYPAFKMSRLHPAEAIRGGRA